MGFDACVDRRDPHWRDRLDEATSDGIDADIENVGGRILDHVLSRINTGARIAMCQMIADYSADPAQRPGIRNLVELVEQRATARGFLVTDHADRFDEITRELAVRLRRAGDDGWLRYEQVVLDGLENAPEALARIFRGTAAGRSSFGLRPTMPRAALPDGIARPCGGRTIIRRGRRAKVAPWRTRQ